MDNLEPTMVVIYHKQKVFVNNEPEPVLMVEKTTHLCFAIITVYANISLQP